MKETVILVVNSGSSSEKLSVFENGQEMANLYFEGIDTAEGKQFICTLSSESGEKKLDKTWDSLDAAFAEAKAIFEAEGIINDAHPLDGIAVRVVAAGKYFAGHHIVDKQTFEELDKVMVTNPLHVPPALKDIKNAQKTFPGVPVALMSDSAALAESTRKDYHYALPAEIVEKYDLARWGAHGMSYGYMMGHLPEVGITEEKVVICHLGSGCSMTAAEYDDKAGRYMPVYTSMGETPLEGLMSSTRTGSIDPTVGAVLGAEMGAAEAIKLMNKQSGLEAMTGSNDMRKVIELAEEGDENAIKAYNMFIDGVAGKIGELAAKMGGVDAIVFTATIGERSIPVRQSVIAKLGFMGFEIQKDVSMDKGAGYTNVAAEGSKPIYIVPTNEAAFMVAEAEKLLSK